MRLLFLHIVLLAGCSTRFLQAPLSANAVASCIEERWKQCGAPGFTVPVIKERTSVGYFVGGATAGMWAFPSGSKHSAYSVWAEITETDAGSRTEYHKSYQFSSSCIDKAVQECQALR